MPRLCGGRRSQVASTERKMRGGDYSVRVYVRWTDLGEEEVPLAAIAERLAVFDADTTLRLLCWVNQLVSFGESNEAEATYHLLGEDMTQRLWRHVQAHGTPAAALQRQQLLVAVRMALLHCSPSGSRRIENDDDRFLLGRLLLQISDHLGRSQQDTSLTSDLIDRPPRPELRSRGDLPALEPPTVRDVQRSLPEDPLRARAASLGEGRLRRRPLGGQVPHKVRCRSGEGLVPGLPARAPDRQQAG